MARSDSSLRPPSPGFPWRKLLLGVGGAMVLLGGGCASLYVCVPAWLRWGMTVDTCPDGRPVQTAWIEATALRRGVYRQVNIGAVAHYTPDRADADWTTDLRPGADLTLTLVSPDGGEQVLEPQKRWARGWGATRQAEVGLPADLPDGDYLLRAELKTRLDESTIEAKLPLYAPARVHVLTDRPLYEPGNEILLRSLVLRAADLTPLAGRPGTWTVIDPDGTTVLEEHVQADDWGVAAGSFPLDREAPSGDWRIRWDSGEDSGQTTVRVEPFTLPRFRVEAAADLPFYQPGQAPTVRGRVTYSSGAPVADAAIVLRWSTSGPWPMPTEWTEGALPDAATTDSSGAFELSLPQVPADLVGQATLFGNLDVSDPAGDRVMGGVSVLLSQDAIAVEAVTELAEGLVEGFNNRLYLRATTADGRPLRDTDLVVRKAWDPGDQGQQARTDADGVAALQVDPGPAVNVVIPPVPVRPPPRTVPARLREVRDLLQGSVAALSDQRVLDGAQDALAPCARFAETARNSQVVLRVDAAGQVSAFPGADPLDRCVGRVLAARRLPAGAHRLYQATVAIDPQDIPRVSVSASAWPDGVSPVRAALAEASLDAAACLPEDVPASSLPRRLEWLRSQGSRAVQTRWLDAGATRLKPEVVRCLEDTLGAITLDPASPDTLARVDEVGTASFSVRPSNRRSVAQPQPTTMLGYELAVTALPPTPSGSTDGSTDGSIDGATARPLGQTLLRLSPGQVPPVRLRAEPILATAGDSVTVDILRGPDFRGELPEKLALRHQDGKTTVAEVDPKARSARFALPADKDGWYSVSWNGAEARVFVRPQGELTVSLTPRQDRYAPGDTALLDVQTKQGGVGAPAAVGLVGVDESLGQLVPLPGPDALETLRDPVETAAPAFGILDGQALSLGRIQGANAAAATVLRVSSIPSPADRDRDVHLRSDDSFDPVADLTDRFYLALSELHAATRRWEATAPADQQMDNKTMARLWKEALAACDAADQPAVDAYGRPLRLHWLPDDLLALTDPRAVVVEGTRLPEDVDPWIPWVQEERP